MKLVDRAVRDFLAALATAEPTPGGGSASALAGAVGASLLTMTAGLPKPRAATAEDIARLRAAGARCAELSDMLTDLIDHDAEAYAQVVAAYRMPKAAGEEKTARTAAIQQAIRVAIEIPLEVMRRCSEGLEQAAVVARLCNQNAASDVRVALELLGAGLRGASFNVEINLATLKDTTYAAAARAESEQLLEHAKVAGEAVVRSLQSAT